MRFGITHPISFLMTAQEKKMRIKEIIPNFPSESLVEESSAYLKVDVEDKWWVVLR